MSHFLVDEDFDRAILKACADRDAAFLQTLPRNKLNGGSSEILNWVAVAGAVEHLDMNWFDYVPGYRTPAGTGTGMSFAAWARSSVTQHGTAPSTAHDNWVCSFCLRLLGAIHIYASQRLSVADNKPECRYTRRRAPPVR